MSASRCNSPVITHPAVDASPAGEHPQYVLETEVVPEAYVQDLRLAHNAFAVWHGLDAQATGGVRAMRKEPAGGEGGVGQTWMATAMSGQQALQMWPPLPQVRTSS